MILACPVLMLHCRVFAIALLVINPSVSGKLVNAPDSQRQGAIPQPASFIDIAELDQVNANVDAMRASLLGSSTTGQTSFAKHPGVQLLHRVGRAGHEVSRVEAAQLHDLAQVLEHFLGDMSSIGKKKD